MWSSRNNLSISATLLFILILVFRYFPKQLSDLIQTDQESIEEGSFFSLIWQAKEEIDYLNDIIRGKALIAAIIEPKKELNFDRFCQKLRSDYVKVGKKNEWVQNFHWWLFSAHFDSRKNSLFPEKKSVQL
uniref:Uncharacterized protein n=1 Tax=Panagrolaimus superbus TaxID=310955 RepID=A0A914YBY4_9BILA